MLKKVIIAEDYESVNISVQKTLDHFGIADPDYVYYCDDALTYIRKALHKNDSYDLLITDLHFDADGREQKIKTGETLIMEAKKLQPDLRILVFSATGKPAIIEALFKQQEIDGYVSKGRNDAKELATAITHIQNNGRYFSRQQQDEIKQKNAHNFTSFDIAIITQMANGMRQKDIPGYLQQKNIQPSGLSSIEKRLNLIKDAYDFSNNEQLIAFCKDKGII